MQRSVLTVDIMSMQHGPEITSFARVFALPGRLSPGFSTDGKHTTERKMDILHPGHSTMHTYKIIKDDDVTGDCVPAFVIQFYDQCNENDRRSERVHTAIWSASLHERAMGIVRPNNEFNDRTLQGRLAQTSVNDGVRWRSLLWSFNCFYQRLKAVP